MAGLRKLHNVDSHYLYFSTKLFWDEVANKTDMDRYVEWIAEMKTAYKLLVRIYVWKRVLWMLSTDEKLALKWWSNTNGTCNICCSELVVLCVVCWTSIVSRIFCACVTVWHLKYVVWMLTKVSLSMYCNTWWCQHSPLVRVISSITPAGRFEGSAGMASFVQKVCD